MNFSFHFTFKIYLYSKEYFKLNQGIESGLLITPTHSYNEFLLIGGEGRYGMQNVVIKYNFEEQTALYKGRMQSGRSLLKGYLYNNQIIIFGGN